MNRQTAVSMLNDKIKSEGSGNKEGQGRTKSNKGIDPTALSLAFINVWWLLPHCVSLAGGGSSPALGTPESNAMRRGIKNMLSIMPLP
jgi:hypothetical protein